MKQALLCLALFSSGIFAADSDFKVVCKTEKVEQILKVPAEANHLKFKVSAEGKPFVDLPVSNVVCHYIRIWNEGTKPARDGRIRITCDPNSKLLVQGDTYDPGRFKSVSFRRVSDSELEWKIERLNGNRLEIWSRCITVAGENADIEIVADGDGWKTKTHSSAKAENILQLEILRGDVTTSTTYRFPNDATWIETPSTSVKQ